jgi:GntR family transcriptional regulator
MFSIDFQSRVPIYEQIVNQVERFIVTGILKENEQLPSVRQIAFDLAINPNTIQKAYTELEKRKIIVSVIGKGNYVTSNINPIINRKTDNLINEIRDNVEALKSIGLSEDDIQKRVFKD